MSKPRIKLRTLTAEEEKEIRRLAKARTEPARKVQRAQLILAMLEEPRLEASKAGIQVGFGSNASGPMWVKRFHKAGLAGLGDKPRAGRPATHNETVRSQVLDLVLQKPRSLGLPFALWTVTRLQAEYEARYGLRLSAATLWRWVQAEGFDWRRQESWFHDPAQHDPEFVEKRGPSSGPT